MDYIELKYSRLVSSYLTGWKDAGNGITRFRCPFCGDSKKSSSKSRGYFYEHSGKCKFKCHNCGASMGLYNFLTEVSPVLAKDYSFERFQKPQKTEVDITDSVKTNTESIFGSRSLLDSCVSIANLDSDHKARAYIEGRKIQEEFFNDLYYIENVLDIMNQLESYKDSAAKMTKRDAIVIPFFDKNRELMCVQFRFFTGDLRYLTLKVTDDAQKIWGLDRVDWTKRVYVCEGMFDASFVPNCIAVAGASIMSVIKYIEGQAKSDVVLIFDKDYRTNYEIYNQVVKAISAGYKIVMFDKFFEAKDINSQIQDYGSTVPEVIEYIESRTFYGLMAKLELSKIRPPKKR